MSIISLSPTCQVELLTGENSEFLGIGQVTLSGVPVRGATHPVVLRLDTPDGILYPRLELLGVDERAEGASIRLRAHGIRWVRGEYADDYDQATVWLSETNAPISDELSLLLTPVGLSLGGRAWEGFSYALQFHSDARQIHRVLIDGTWEIGGSLIGNTVLSQGQCNMPVYHGARDTIFTTTCLKTLDQYGKPHGNSFQLGPRGGLVQGFDFQYADAGALLQYWPALDSISSLLESSADSELLHIVDEYRFPLSASVTTPAKWVLFTPGPLAEHEAHDLWWEARANVYGRSCATFGITPTLPVPEVGMKYTARVLDGRLRMHIAGEEVDSTEVPYAIAERILPVLAAQGIKRFFPEVMNDNDVTAFGMKCKLDYGMHGDLHCSSVCGTHRFFPSATWGGIQAWKYMADKAHALDMKIGAWFAPHLSPRAPIFVEHPEYCMVGVNGLAAGGGYGFQTIVVADWNTPIADWALEDLRRWRAEGGLDYLFVDSLSNMGLVQANYAAAMRTNFAALGRLFGAIQRLGISSLSCECISPWMTGQFGVADPRGDLLAQNRAVAGQNDFSWWADQLDMTAGCSLFINAHARTPDELAQFQFRAMASGGCLSYPPAYDLDYQLPAWWSRLNHLLNQAQPHMRTRRVLPDHGGMVWEDGEVHTLWTFRELPLSLPTGVQVRQLDGQKEQALPGDGQVILPAWGVYRWEGTVQ